MPEDHRLDITKLVGTIGELKASIDGRFVIHERRLSELESWQKKSEDFHVEMRKRWDRFDGAQAAQEKIQALRHEENQTAMQSVANKIGTANLIVAILGVLLALALGIIGYQAGTHHAQLDPTHLLSNDPQKALAQFNAKDE
jgi:hypothetical protein